MVKYDFSEKVVLVTGGTSGIGLATARAFAKAGGKVVLAARDERKGKEVAEALQGEGAAASFVRCDVREEKDVSRAVDFATGKFGALHLAFNCAGLGGDFSPMETASQTVWDDVMATSARGVWLSMRYEIPAILRAGGGAIVNMGSIYGEVGKAAHHAYVASRHAILGLTKSVGLEYATRGVRVNAINAGVTGTEGMQNAKLHMPALVQALEAEHPMSRMASPAEVAAAVLWLCSDEAGFVTATAINVDGGFLAR